MSTATIIAVCLTAIALGSFVLFVAGAMNVASEADDAMDARLLDGDGRPASFLNDNPQHRQDSSR